jgi:hypothetical protein
MSNDALERLKNKKRPSVPNRDSSLQPGNVDTSISRNQETPSSRTQDKSISKQKDIPTSSNTNVSLSKTEDISIAGYRDSKESNDRDKLKSEKQEIQTSSKTDTLKSRTQDIEISEDRDTSRSSTQKNLVSKLEGVLTSSNTVIQASISQDISIPGYQDNQIPISQLEPLKTKQTTLRLEITMSERLSAVCGDNNISREVFLEALFQHYETDREAWEAIATEAKKRADRRMQFANLKRAQSMMQRFSS